MRLNISDGVPSLAKKPESTRNIMGGSAFRLSAVGFWRSVKTLKQIVESFPAAERFGDCRVCGKVRSKAICLISG